MPLLSGQLTLAQVALAVTVYDPLPEARLNDSVQVSPLADGEELVTFRGAVLVKPPPRARVSPGHDTVSVFAPLPLKEEELVTTS